MRKVRLSDRLGSACEALIGLALDKYDDIEPKYETVPTSNCRAFCRKNQLCDKKGKIYITPDFVIYRSKEPIAVIYVTLWQSSTYCHLKFWRTIEELFEHKLYLNDPLLCMNFLFKAKKRSDGSIESPGWNAGNLIAMDWIFDDTYYFWDDSLFPLIEKVAEKMTGTSIEEAAKLLKKELEGNEQLLGFFEDFSEELYDRLTKGRPKENLEELWHLEREFCFSRTEEVKKPSATPSRWRMGILRYILLYRLLQGSLADHDFNVVVHDLIAAMYFKRRFRDIISSSEIPLSNNDLISLIQRIDVIIRKTSKKTYHLVKLRPSLGGFEVEFDEDLEDFLGDLYDLPTKKRRRYYQILEILSDLYENKKPSIKFAFKDIKDQSRIERKVQMIHKIFDNKNQEDAKNNLFGELIVCDENPSQLVDDLDEQTNWILETALLYADVSSYELVHGINEDFNRRVGIRLEDISPYGDIGRLVPNIISRKINLKRDVKEKLFMEFSTRVAQRLIESKKTKEEIEDMLLEKKVKRILEAPDIRPLHDLINALVSSKELKKESGDSLFTDYMKTVEGKYYRVGQTEFNFKLEKNLTVYVKIQSAQEGNEGHKRKELSGRARAFRYKAVLDDGHVRFKPKNISLWLILDGDWVKSAMTIQNLYESGFDRFYSVRDLDLLVNDLVSK